jgi:signal transduction histidine kinase/CheY-like chemotaxis protein/ligand-binding sensor domain-containing protein
VLHPADAARLQFRVFRDQDGLPQNSAQTIAVDAEGRIWAGTQDGAAVYNGRVWRVVDMPSKRITNSVRVILQASNGDLWFGCDGAVNRLRGDEWTTFTRNDGVPEGWTRTMLELPGTNGQPEIWIGTDSGYGRFDGSTWTEASRGTPLEGASVRTLYIDDAPGGRSEMRIGTDGKGLWSMEAPFRGSPVRDESFPAASAFCCVRTRGATGSSGSAGELLAGTETGIVRASASGWQPVDVVDGRTFSVRCLLQTRSSSGDSILWAGTYDNGLLVRERGLWTIYDSSTGLPHDKIDCLMSGENADGVATTMWIGTDAGGIARTELGRWRTLAGPAASPHPVVLSIRETTAFTGRPELWVGTYGSGVLRWVDGAWQTTGPLAPPAMSGAWALLESKSTAGVPELWVGTDGNGVLRYSSGRWTRFDPTNGFPNALVYCLLESRDDRGERVIWAGTGGSGVVRYSGGRWTPFGVAEGVPSAFIQCMTETVDANGARTLWVGTLGGGLGRFRSGVWTQFNTTSGFPNDTVYSLTTFREDDGRHYVLIGTAGSGLLRFDPADDNPAFAAIAGPTSETPLPNNVVYNPVFDSRGRLYIPTNKGITRLASRDEAAGPPRSLGTYTVDDGLPSNECDVGTTMVDSLGRIWIGTVRGLGVLDPSEDIAYRAESRILLEPTMIDDRRVRGTDLGEISHRDVKITFEYSLLTTFREQDTRYRTQLVGLEDRPTEWTTDFKRQFTSLPPGDYVFRIWAYDFVGAEAPPVDVAFVVRPAPWLTWWAFALYAVGGLALVYAGVRWRLAALKRRNQELEERIVERTAEIAESERRALEANRAKSVFLANMSHELRTPLNAILGFLQLLDRERDLTVRHRETLGIIARSGEHLLSLINDVLSVSKIEAGQVTPTLQVLDLRRLLQGLEEMFRVRAEQKALEFRFDVDAEVPRFVVGDEAKLRQILINLLGNAFKFTDAGEVELTARWMDGRGSFTVRDTGQGIEPSEMGNLFEPFVQTRSGQRAREGTGLGLAISRNFARIMGGDITVVSESGAGSTFTVEIALPRTDQEVVAQEQRKVRALAAGQPSYRVLVVDDKWENRLLLVRLLEDVGMTVREAENGREAVDVWAEWQPELIWMDVRMPVMDGLEATRAIRDRAKGNGPVIIALTASAFEQEREAILASGCDDYVAKPFREEEIFARMSRHLGAVYVFDGAAEGGVAHAKTGSVATGRNDEPAGGVPKSTGRLSPSSLASVDGELLLELREAVVLGDVQALLVVVERIGASDPDLAAQLAALVRAYEFESMQRLLDGDG